MPAKYRIVSARRMTTIDERGQLVDSYRVDFTLLDTMAASYIDIPVAIFTKELRDKMITAEVKRLEDMTGSSS